jgi:hypothetical protein
MHHLAGSPFPLLSPDSYSAGSSEYRDLAPPGGVPIDRPGESLGAGRADGGGVRGGEPVPPLPSRYRKFSHVPAISGVCGVGG